MLISRLLPPISYRRAHGSVSVSLPPLAVGLLLLRFVLGQPLLLAVGPLLLRFVLGQPLLHLAQGLLCLTRLVVPPLRLLPRLIADRPSPLHAVDHFRRLHAPPPTLQLALSPFTPPERRDHR